MRYFALGMSLIFSSAFAKEAKVPPKNQRPYDYDLFSKDRETWYVDLEGLALKLLNNQPVGAKYDTASERLVLNGLAETSPEPGVPVSIKNLDWLWRPGFRFTLGYFNAPKYWEVMGQYTWFQDEGHKTIKSPGTASDTYLCVGSYLPALFQGDHVSRIHSHAELYYNDLSTLVSRNFYPNPHLRLRVVGGLTSMWAHQTTNTKNEFFETPTTLNYRFHSKYWGVGFKMGAGADWYWGKDFYITGKVFWAIVTGRWNTSTKVFDSNNDLYIQPYDSAYKTSQNFQFIFGPSYQKSFENFRWELFLGYEFNSWLGALATHNYNQEYYPQSWVYPQPFFEDLTLTGVNLRLTLDF